ncbi:hypothetical protein Scep_028714 [Stephania cephalantha]|uniref:Uncharacterized protein n=1 Tax=Stephania cephalantha TaxID=152367 RepID=A0AAP0EDM8_9MAGN
MHGPLMSYFKITFFKISFIIFYVISTLRIALFIPYFNEISPLLEELHAFGCILP